jgi:hypothetical protein
MACENLEQAGDCRMEPVSTGFPIVLALTPFSPVEPGFVRALEVQVLEASAGRLDLRYVLDGAPGRWLIPPSRASRQADELWRHTCFEVFLRSRGSAAYYELNFSPSSEWGLYSFESYRKGMAPVSGAPSPEISVQRTAHQLQMDVRVDLRSLSRPGTLGLAAVIEDENARLSYWALKHPAPQPDFHHPDAFALELPE